MAGREFTSGLQAAPRAQMAAPPPGPPLQTPTPAAHGREEWRWIPDKGGRPAWARRSHDEARLPPRTERSALSPRGAAALTARRGCWPGAVRMSSAARRSLCLAWEHLENLLSFVLIAHLLSLLGEAWISASSRWVFLKCLSEYFVRGVFSSLRLFCAPRWSRSLRVPRRTCGCPCAAPPALGRSSSGAYGCWVGVIWRWSYSLRMGDFFSRKSNRTVAAPLGFSPHCFLNFLQAVRCDALRFPAEKRRVTLSVRKETGAARERCCWAGCGSEYGNGRQNFSRALCYRRWHKAAPAATPAVG